MTVSVSPLAHPDRFFIDGEWAAPSSASKIDVINSGTEELFVSVAEAQAADIIEWWPPRIKHSIRVRGRA